MTYETESDDAFVPGDECPDDLGEEYIRREGRFDEARMTSRLYAKGSNSLLNGVRVQWYCQQTRKDPVAQLKLFATNVLYHFFHFLLSTRRKTLRHASTLQTYWNTLCLLRKRETGLHIITPQVKDAMVGVRQQLARRFHLETEKEPKPIVRAEDEFALLTTLWSSPSLTLDHERLRVQLALIAQLAGITGNRPGALLGLLYKDLKVTLLRDPHGSHRPKVLLELTFKNTKTYRGPKDPNTFPIPEICDESCLPLCPQIVLLGMMFADGAFEAPSLTGPDALFKLRIPSYLNQLELPIRGSLAKVPIFRAVEQTANGYRVSPTIGASGGWLRQQFRRWGEATGFELPLKPYGFRRGNGEALDSSNHVSDAQRNVILQHGSSSVFERNYLSRYITRDTQAAYRGLVPQTALVRLASGMTRSIDVRQPTSLTPQQVAEVDQHPELQLLLRTRKSLAARLRERYGTASRAEGTDLYNRYQTISKEFCKQQKAFRRLRMKHIKSRFRKEQALVDIERQLNASLPKPSDELDAKLQFTSAQSVARLSDERRLAYSTLFANTDGDLSEERGRRSSAIQAITALCKRREPHRRQACLSKRTEPGNADPTRRTAEVRCPRFPQQCLPTQCIFCLGNVELALDVRIKSFRDCYSLSKHFKRAHLDHIADDALIACPHPQCAAQLLHKQHLQQHAQDVHNTRT